MAGDEVKETVLFCPCYLGTRLVFSLSDALECFVVFDSVKHLPWTLGWRQQSRVDAKRAPLLHESRIRQLNNTGRHKVAVWDANADIKTGTKRGEPRKCSLTLPNSWGKPEHKRFSEQNDDLRRALSMPGCILAHPRYIQACLFLLLQCPKDAFTL